MTLFVMTTSSSVLSFVQVIPVLGVIDEPLREKFRGGVVWCSGMSEHTPWSPGFNLTSCLVVKKLSCG